MGGTHSRPKTLRLTGGHLIKGHWEEDLDDKALGLLNSMQLKWTSVDIVRIGFDGEPAPVILWIEVIPGSLTGDQGVFVVQRVREILEEYHITDVDVEIHMPNLT